MAAPDYISTYAKLRRANEHFQQLDAEIAAWHHLCKDSFAIERGAYDTRVGLVIQMDGPPGDFLRWTLIAGDCINNARSALDHLIYAIGDYEATKNPTSDHHRNQFVIADSPAEFSGEAKRRLKCLTPAVIAAIESVQPYTRTHPVLPPLLKMLRKFSNADKHRLLQLAASGISITAGTIIGDDTRGKKSVAIVPDPVNNHDIVCVALSDQPDPYLNFHEMTIAMEVCIWHDLRDGETNPLLGRTGYSVLIPALLTEVKYILDTVTASVT